jgi:hypothetical protein
MRGGRRDGREQSADGRMGESVKRRSGETGNGGSEKQTMSFPNVLVGNLGLHFTISHGRCNSRSGSPACPARTVKVGGFAREDVMAKEKMHDKHRS